MMGSPVLVMTLLILAAQQAFAADDPAISHGHIVGAADSLGGMMCILSRNIAPFYDLMVGISYIAGAIMIGIGLSQLAYFTDTFSANKQYGIARPKGLLVAGAGLLALPAFINVCVGSIFGVNFGANYGNGLNGCMPEINGGGGIAGEVGLDGLMLNLVYNIKGPMVYMLSTIAILAGVFLIIRGLVKASRFGTDQRTHSIPIIITNIVIGTVLFSLGTSMDSVLTSVFGGDSIEGSGNLMNTILADFDADVAPFQRAVYAALTFFQLIGMIAFIRGWLILKNSVEGQGQATVAQGLTHIIGGVLCVNIYRFLEVMDTTFGTGFL
jgi:hypothetical protein